MDAATVAIAVVRRDRRHLFPAQTDSQPNGYVTI